MQTEQLGFMLAAIRGSVMEKEGPPEFVVVKQSIKRVKGLILYNLLCFLVKTVESPTVLDKLVG